MSWGTWSEAIRDAIALALELEDFTGSDGVTAVPRVEWENRSSASRWCEGAWADLQLGAVVPRHTDEYRYDFVDGGTPETSTISATTGGPRVATVTVRIGAPEQDPAAAAPGFLAGKLRTRMRRQGVLDLLHDAGVSLISIGNTLNADYADNNSRMWSGSFTDLRFGVTETDTETGLPYIDRVVSDPANTLTRPDETTIVSTFDVDSEA